MQFIRLEIINSINVLKINITITLLAYSFHFQSVRTHELYVPCKANFILFFIFFFFFLFFLYFLICVFIGYPCCWNRHKFYYNYVGNDRAC